MSEAGMLARAPGCAVLFGGIGFIGSFSPRFLVDGGHFQRVYLVDRQPVTAIASVWRRAQLSGEPAIEWIDADVRESPAWEPPESVALTAPWPVSNAGCRACLTGHCGPRAGCWIW